MNDIKILIEEIKFFVERNINLNQFALEQLSDRFNKDSYFIEQIYQILLRNKALLPFFYDIEAAIYEYIVHEEMENARTYYGATKYVAEQFDTTQTYIKSKIKQSKVILPLQKIS